MPGAEVHHVGATAIPGAVTKGDLDVLIRVDGHDFHEAVEKLRSTFCVKQPENWDPCFASFGTDTEFRMQVGVQLVVRDSEADFFLFVRDYLIEHPQALQEYYELKLKSLDGGSEGYWSAKDRFLSAILKRRPQKANKAPEPTTTAVTSPAAQEPRQP